jgi:hypothetical protein
MKEAHISTRKEDTMKKQKITLMLIVSLAALAAGCSTAVNETKSAYANERPGATANLEGIEAPANERRAFSLAAVGTQNYACQPKDDHYEWAATPEADLYNEKGEKVGRHKAGPTWETIDGASNVVGDKALAKAKSAPSSGPSIRTDAIDWLRLPAKSTAGDGMFSQIKTIQRVNTLGGKGPAGPCDPAKDAKPVPVFYSATYHFYVAAQ